MTHESYGYKSCNIGNGSEAFVRMLFLGSSNSIVPIAILSSGRERTLIERVPFMGPRGESQPSGQTPVGLHQQSSTVSPNLTHLT